MPHIVLLGDSILDNGAYTAGGPAVTAQLRQQLPAGWQASLVAVDGSTTEDIPAQLAKLPPGATHLVLSVGGNDALRHAGILATPVAASSAALLLLSEVALEFEADYRRAVDACLRMKFPLFVCTIYNGNFPDADYQRCATVALTVLNDAIIRVAIDKQLSVIDLRFICNSPADYANPIEPSSAGGLKITQAIVNAVTEPACRGGGAHIFGA